MFAKEISFVARSSSKLFRCFFFVYQVIEYFVWESDSDTKTFANDLDTDMYFHLEQILVSICGISLNSSLVKGGRQSKFLNFHGQSYLIISEICVEIVVKLTRCFRSRNRANMLLCIIMKMG